jgi:hypothetical protein
MMRKYAGNKKSIEARSNDGGRTWEGKLFDAGRETKFSEATEKELDDLATKEGMRRVS